MKVNKLAKEIYGSNYETFAKAGLTEKGCTGKTTAHALKVIAETLESPGKEIYLSEPDKHLMLIRASGGFLGVVKHVIKTLNLRFIVINEMKMTIKYDLFEEVKDQAVESDPISLLKEKLSEATLKGNLEAVTTYSQAIQRLQ